MNDSDDELDKNKKDKKEAQKTQVSLADILLRVKLNTFSVESPLLSRGK